LYYPTLIALALSSASHFGCAATPIAPSLVARIGERPPIGAGRIALRWLGAAGFEIRTAGRTLLVDPYLTRAPVSTILFGRLEPDREVLEKLDADLILIGHSHFDHLLDAPAISARTGASIVASKDACIVAHGLDPKSRCLAAPIARRFFHRGFELTAIPQAHGETLFGVPLDGTNDRPPPRTPHAFELRKGEPLLWIVRAAGVTIVHASTAGLPHDPLALKRHAPDGADVLLLAVALRENTPGYTRHLIDMLRPKVIVPHHGGLEAGTLEDEVDEAFLALAKEEGDRVRIPRPFEPMIFGRSELSTRRR
jgi:L-ascorbate metabolism protein UlaG (beta-lactamase superfamily)